MTERAFTPYDGLLFALVVFAWSGSWYALSVNANSFVVPEVSIVWRFLSAALVMFVWAAGAGMKLRFSLREHGAFAAMGVLIFSSNFILYYYASFHVVSGLLAVMFSLASVVNLVLNALGGDFAGPRRWLGASLGAVGIALLYWPSLADGGGAAIGFAYCLLGTFSFCTGNVVSGRLQAAQVPLIPASAWGMLYGAAWAATLSVQTGSPFAFDWSVPYLVSLGWLSIVSTVLAFWAYLTLLGRIGAGRAAYATVMFPIFALLISTVAEGYEWTPLALAGVALALLGNLFVLRRQLKPEPRPAPSAEPA